MRIGIDIRCLMNSNYSGVGWYAYNVLENLFRIDTENKYVLFYNSSKEVKLPEFKGKNITFRGFRYPNKLFSILNYLNLVNLDKMIGVVDVFWSPNLNFISWSKKGRKILTIHDLSFLIFPEFFPLKTLWWHKLIINKIINKVDIIITDSQSTKLDLIKLLKVSAEKIKVVYLGVSESYRVLSPSPLQGEGWGGVNDLLLVKQKYNLPDKFIFYVGALEPRKNIESIIEAFKMLGGDESLVIAGTPGWKNEKIYELAKGDERIKFLGYVREEDKPALYNLASMLAYPSHYEGFGLPLIEAMACGCPVIAGANSSQLEVVGEAGLLVDPNNLNEIKFAMTAMIGDNELRNKYIELGLARAKEFSWEKTAREILENFN